MMLQTTISFLLLLVVIKISGGNKITIGKAAEVKCKEWNKGCDPGFLCVIQHLQWPMNMSFPICIPESEISGMLVQVKLRICHKPPQPGNCGARWVRWYYNTHIQRCSWFYYQGCRGNENNFKSKSQCEAECMPNQQTNVIEKPLTYGSNNPVVVTEPKRSPDYSNYIDKAYSMVRSKEVGDYDRRRKRRLEKRRQKRIRRLMRKRRKSMRSKKRRREGKVKTKGGKKKRKNRKKKNKNKKKGRRGKKKKNKKSKGEKSTITFIPGDKISDTNSDLMKKLVSQESSTVKQEEKRKDPKS